MITLGNDEMKGLPKLKKTIKCPHCGKRHVIKQSDPEGLQFYTCGTAKYLAGIDGINITSKFKKK